MEIPKIIYLTWGSTPRLNSVYGSQVIDQLIKNSKALPNANFSLVAGVPIINSGLLHRRFNFFGDLRHIAKKLKAIDFRVLPIYASQSCFNSTRQNFHKMQRGGLRYLKKNIVETSPNIVHCRSYHAAWVALQARKELKAAYRIIFDARGLWPEEVSLKHGKQDSSKNFFFRKNIESQLLAECDVTIAVSDPMMKYFQSLGVERCELIPLSSCEPLKEIHQHEHLSSPHLIYVGGLSNDTWHKPLQLVELFRHIRKITTDCKLTIVTTSPYGPIRRAFKDFSDTEFQITTTQTPSQLLALLKDSTLGALSYFNPSTALEKRVASTVFAIKTAEYLSAGVPVLVNKSCAAAAEFITANKVGIAYSPDYHEITKSRLDNLMQIERRILAKKIAANEFSFDVNAKRFAKVYSSLL